MNENEIKVIAESLIEASKVGTANALTYIQKGLEAYKKVEIPYISNDGQYSHLVRAPYREDKEVRTFVDFMLVYLDEALKELDKKDRSDERFKNGKY